MKPVDRRKLISALHRACAPADLELEDDPDAGGGSHGSLLFSDRRGGKPLRIVIVYSREISPGVQRAILQMLDQRIQRDTADYAARALAIKVRDLLAGLFSV